MPSGIKTTNDVESVINAAMIKKWSEAFNIRIKLLGTMGDDALLIYDIP